MMRARARARVKSTRPRGGRRRATLSPMAALRLDGPTVLARVAAGTFDAIRWADVPAAAGGHTATFRVFADALSIDGVRVSVSARTAQGVADLLSCSLLTAKLADLAWTTRTVTLLPLPANVVTQTDAAQSAALAAALAKALAAQAGSSAVLVQTVGKHWIIDNDTTGKRAKDGSLAACNYGWHFPGSTFDGKAWEPAVTLPYRVIQGRGWAHGVDHVDYSQTCVLVSRGCIVDGRAADLGEVLGSAELAPLASAQGIVRARRQQGIDQAPSTASMSADDVTLPLRAPDVSQCPIGFPPLANVLPWGSATASAALQAWAGAQLKYPLGTVIRSTVDGLPVVGRVECHNYYGAHPELAPKWHKGVTLFRPASPDVTGKLVALVSAPHGWPGS